MKTLMERKAALSAALSFIGNIDTFPTKTVSILCAPDTDLSNYGFQPVSWAPFIWMSGTPLPKDHELFSQGKVFSIGLASVYACLQLARTPDETILDMCAAPGLKSAYLRLLLGNNAEIYVNDLSRARMSRLKRLHESLGLKMPHTTTLPGEDLLTEYSAHSFDRVLIDAPCSGEGKILAGDDKSLAAWSPAKVKRLSQLQRKLLRTGEKLLTLDGELVYSTCTLNKTENEKVVKHSVNTVDAIKIDLDTPPQLVVGQAVRILPSEYSIGFFVAKTKSSTIEDRYE